MHLPMKIATKGCKTIFCSLSFRASLSVFPEILLYSVCRAFGVLTCLSHVTNSPLSLISIVIQVEPVPYGTFVHLMIPLPEYMLLGNRQIILSRGQREESAEALAVD
jgi:hypothetical protein